MSGKKLDGAERNEACVLADPGSDQLRGQPPVGRGDEIKLHADRLEVKVRIDVRGELDVPEQYTVSCFPGYPRGDHVDRIGGVGLKRDPVGGFRPYQSGNSGPAFCHHAQIVLVGVQIAF